MNSIIIIGTEPPCPRCKLLKQVIADKVKQLAIHASITNLVYTDADAKAFAAGIGLETGTSGTVANRLQLKMDPTPPLSPDFDSEFNVEYEDYFTANWSYELDEHLRVYEKKAMEAGILMTPTLIINGDLKHSGSVPRLAQIEAWLMELKEV